MVKSRKTPDELLQLMEKAASDYEQAIEKLRKLEMTKSFNESTASVILSAKRWDLLKNEALRNHFKACCEDPKFRLTNDLIHNFTYLEHRSIFEDYEYWEKVAKQAEKDHEMWARHLMWHQSQNKVKSAELMSLRD